MKNVGANGIAMKIIEASPWENAMVFTKPIRRAMIGALKNDRAARKLDIKNSMPRDLSSTPKRKKEPVGEQPARHARAEVVDEG